MSEEKTLFDEVLKVYIDNEYKGITLEEFKQRGKYPIDALFCFTQMLYEYQIKLTNEQIEKMMAVLTPEQALEIRKKAIRGDTFF